MVSVVIVTTNNFKGLSDCIKSLQNQSFNDLETTVVFNNSPEAIIKTIKSNFGKINFILNKENFLFCKAYNQGIRQSKREYVLCLNDDVILENNFIEQLVKTINIDERIGMVSGKILRMDKTTIDSTGLFLGKSRKPIERGFNQQDNGRYNKEGYIFGVSGAAAFYRKTMLEEIKNGDEYFDESYGLFYEDLDISWRANRAGWKAYYNPKAVAYHFRGGTAKTEFPSIKYFKRYCFPYLSDDLQFHLLKNRYMTIIKNDLLPNFFLSFVDILSYELRLWSYILLFRPRIILRIHEIFKFLKIAFEKRKSIKRKISNG